jgi:hypothetical protein
VIDSVSPHPGQKLPPALNDTPGGVLSTAILSSCEALLPAASEARSDTLCVPSPSAIGPP